MRNARSGGGGGFDLKRWIMRARPQYCLGHVNERQEPCREYVGQGRYGC